MSKAKKLTDKQNLFCIEYLVDLNATQAAIRAGYSQKSACSIANENFRKPAIRERIRELKAAKCFQIEVTGDRVLDELRTIAFAESGVTTGVKIRALDLLGKHTKLYDEPAYTLEKFIAEAKKQEETSKRTYRQHEQDFVAIINVLPVQVARDLYKYVEEQGHIIRAEDGSVAEYKLEALITLVNKDGLDNLMDTIKKRIMDSLSWAAKRAG